MTKNLTAVVIKGYLDKMSLSYRAGRSEIAQQLHSVMSKSRKEVVDAAVAHKELSGLASQVYSGIRFEDVSTEAEKEMPQGGKDSACAPALEKKGVADRDAWSLRGESGVWQREHRRSRRSLFTPFRVAAGPSSNAHFIRLRKTSGIDLSSMRKFEIVDDWTQSSNAHRLLPFDWVGKSEFRLVREEFTDYNVGSLSSLSMSNNVWMIFCGADLKSIGCPNSSSTGTIADRRIHAPMHATTDRIPSRGPIPINHRKVATATLGMNGHFPVRHVGSLVDVCKHSIFQSDCSMASDRNALQLRGSANISPSNRTNDAHAMVRTFESCATHMIVSPETDIFHPRANLAQGISHWYYRQ